MRVPHPLSAHARKLPKVTVYFHPVYSLAQARRLKLEQGGSSRLKNVLRIIHELSAYAHLKSYY